jgi:pyruvate carboxylase
MAEGKPADTFEEAVSDGEAPKEAQSISRIRANSSIMQLKKILGKSSPDVRDAWKR